MKRIGIVISNHGAEPTTEKQMVKEFVLDEVIYFQHPNIHPEWTKEKVWEITKGFLQVEGIMDFEVQGGKVPPQAMEGLAVCIVNGEYGFSTASVFYLEQAGIRCYYPTTERDAVEKIKEDGSIEYTHTYRFVRFRRW
tara:strand:+ start:2540 stop:2953 length:414 start_codon:yes stop_codon:yes gene_type:complete